MSEDLEEIAPRSLRGVPAASEKLLGQDVDGRYLLVREVGRGGLSTVFHAEHRYTGRTFALKLLSPELRDHPEARMRLMTEARMLGAVRHPYVVEVHDAGIVRGGALSGMPFLVMERLPAKSLEALITARGKLSLRDAMVIAKFAASALGAVHAAGIVHRDVKPGNLLVVRQDRGSKGLKLIDFGAATVASRGGDSDGPASTLVGTPLYMAPEHMAGQRVTPAADVYALGISLYECLTGQVPFRGTFEQVYAQSATAPRPDVRRERPDTPDPLAALIRRCLSVDPDARPRDGSALLEALEEVQIQITSGVSSGGGESATSRRSQIRVSYAAPVEIRVPTGEVVDGTIQDISLNGVFILAMKRIADESELVLRFAVPGGPIVSVPGRVRWSRASATGDGCAIGVELGKLPTEERGLLEDFVKRAEV